MSGGSTERHGRPVDRGALLLHLARGGLSPAPWDSLNLGLHVQDDPGTVQANRARLRLSLPAEPLWLEQVHGTQVCEADADGIWRARGVPCADAAVTEVRGRPLAIMTADCLPVVLADGAGTVLGVAHAGWRGLAAGVLENTVAALRRRVPRAAGWRAWLGPAIGQAAFEVGDEVYEAFVDQDPAAAACFERWPHTDRWHADLAGLARLRLVRAGVSRVESSGECTYRQADRYFSYRRQARTGRQATLAWLT
ncbi:Purine nucleoside phosphorylase OS=Castellaniella defragrans OX=75697 GN=HNR28_001192 PE=3 SV=1 [Castellaniella defragrans]